MSSKLKLIVLIFLCAQQGYCEWEYGAGEYLVKENANFAVYYHHGIKQYADAVAGNAPSIKKELETFSGLKDTTLIKIILPVTEEEFNRLTLNHIPDWGIGCAISGQRSIVLKTSRLKRGSEELNQILTHEISHLILGSVSDSSMIPKWFDEGLAVYVSHQWGFWESILISGAILGKALIPLDEIEYQFPEKSFKAGLAYAEGYTVINFIINRFGQNRLKNILIELKKGSDFYKALETSLQINQDLFQTEWKNFIFQQYKWIYVINNSQLFWIFLCLLFIIAYVRKRITSRRKFENLDKLP